MFSTQLSMLFLASAFDSLRLLFSSVREGLRVRARDADLIPFPIRACDEDCCSCLSEVSNCEQAGVLLVAYLQIITTVGSLPVENSILKGDAVRYYFLAGGSRHGQIEQYRVFCLAVRTECG